MTRVQAFVEASLGCGALILLLAYAVVSSKIYCDCSTLSKRMSARLWELATQWRVGAGFALTLMGTYLMFWGAEKLDAENDDNTDDDDGFESDLLRSHRRWFTRAQIMRSLAAVVVLNVVLSPLQKTTGDTVEEQVGGWEAERHTAMASSFLLIYMLSHDRHRAA